MQNNKLVLMVMVLLTACTNKQVEEINTLDLQGHRGCRGLLPENTIPAFLKALDIGVTTLEMDLVISKDKQVIVSHEPFFSHEIATDPAGNLISKEQELQHNMYVLSYEAIKRYDVGMRPHERFPKQKKIPVVKPLFLDVVKAAEAAVAAKNYPKPFYNIEIKRKSEQDTIYHPSGKEFAKLVVDAVQATGIKDRIVIQSFDKESLRLVRALDDNIDLVLLVSNLQTAKQNIQELGFQPEIYSPYFKLVNEELVNFCKSKNISLIPWTVNEEADMKQMIELGVDGIITDYPDVLKNLLDSMNINIKRYEE